MMSHLGKFPKKMLRKGEFTPLHFDGSFNFLQQDVDKISQKNITRTITVTKALKPLKELMGPGSGNAEDKEEYALFVDLLEKCLNLDPARRLSVLEAQMHPFITGLRN